MKFKVIHIKQVIATLVVAVVVCAATGIRLYVRNYTAQRVSASNLKGKVILIDPGHGGFDSGASANGIVEKNINLEVAKYLKEYIEAGGGAVYMTRDADKDTADPNRAKGITQKKSDMQMRKSDIKKYKVDIFISVHMNKFEQSEYRGAQVFYDDDSEQNKFLAEAIQQGIKDVLKDGNNRVAKNMGNGIFVLKDNEIPSALIECGFLSNADEAKLLSTAEYQKKVAEGIYKGLMKFVDTPQSEKK